MAIIDSFHYVQSTETLWALLSENPLAFPALRVVSALTS